MAVGEIACDFLTDIDFCVTSSALQQANKSYLVGYCEDANLCAIHVKCLIMAPEETQRALRTHGKGGQKATEGKCLNLEIK